MEGLKMKYFVLKPSGNDKYAEASRKAMFAYANAIRNENEKLADDLFEWARSEVEKTEEYQKAVSELNPHLGE